MMNWWRPSPAKSSLLSSPKKAPGKTPEPALRKTDSVVSILTVTEKTDILTVLPENPSDEEREDNRRGLSGVEAGAGTGANRQQGERIEPILERPSITGSSTWTTSPSQELPVTPVPTISPAVSYTAGEGPEGFEVADCCELSDILKKELGLCTEGSPGEPVASKSVTVESPHTSPGKDAKKMQNDDAAAFPEVVADERAGAWAVEVQLRDAGVLAEVENNIGALKSLVLGNLAKGYDSLATATEAALFPHSHQMKAEKESRANIIEKAGPAIEAAQEKARVASTSIQDTENNEKKSQTGTAASKLRERVYVKAFLATEIAQGQDKEVAATQKETKKEPGKAKVQKKEDLGDDKSVGSQSSIKSLSSRKIKSKLMRVMSNAKDSPAVAEAESSQKDTHKESGKPYVLGRDESGEDEKSVASQSSRNSWSKAKSKLIRGLSGAKTSVAPPQSSSIDIMNAKDSKARGESDVSRNETNEESGRVKVKEKDQLSDDAKSVMSQSSKKSSSMSKTSSKLARGLSNTSIPVIYAKASKAFAEEKDEQVKSEKLADKMAAIAKKELSSVADTTMTQEKQTHEVTAHARKQLVKVAETKKIQDELSDLLNADAKKDQDKSVETKKAQEKPADKAAVGATREQFKVDNAKKTNKKAEEKMTEGAENEQARAAGAKSAQEKIAKEVEETEKHSISPFKRLTSVRRIKSNPMARREVAQAQFETETKPEKKLAALLERHRHNLFDYFQIVISKDITDMMVRLPSGADHTFADLRSEINEDIDLPFASFRFTVEAGGLGVHRKQERKWRVRDYSLTEQGDGSYRSPYQVYIVEAKK